MIQCRLCGHKFDETKIGPCTCNCPIGDCHGSNVLCPNCGYDVPVPKEKQQVEENNSFFSRIKNSLG